MTQSSENQHEDAMAKEDTASEILQAIAGEQSVRLDELVNRGIAPSLKDILGPVTKLIQDGTIECILDGSTQIRVRQSDGKS